MLWRLVYISTAVELLEHGALREMVRRAAEKNASLGITGELMYSGGTFMQVLEGARGAVAPLFDRIAEDARHAFVRVIFQGPCAERMFEAWSMGLCNLDQAGSVPLEEFLAIKRFLEACPAVDGDAAARGVVERFRRVAALAACASSGAVHWLHAERDASIFRDFLGLFRADRPGSCAAR